MTILFIFFVAAIHIAVGFGIAIFASQHYRHIYAPGARETIVHSPSEEAAPQSPPPEEPAPSGPEPEAVAPEPAAVDADEPVQEEGEAEMAPAEPDVPATP